MENIQSVEENQEVEISRVEFPLLYCLKYLLDFYYGEISIDTILSFSAKSDNGFTKELAINVVKEVGINAVEKEIKGTNIPNHFLPCIVFDENSNPFVFKKKAKECLLYDPIENKEVKRDLSYLNNFTTAILVFRDPKKEALIDDLKGKEWFWDPVKQYWKSYVEIGVLTFFINMFALAVPLFSMNV